MTNIFDLNLWPIGPVYYISGHLDLTEEEFDEHYAPEIDRVIKQNNGYAHFVVGDARGADTMAQRYLHDVHATARVVVFHMFDKPRNCVSPDFATRGGYKTDCERDEAMTEVSEDDIAWVRPGREKSGTAKNLQRRKERRNGRK